MATKDAIKLSLGEDLYLTHTTFKNMDRIHIRKFISMPSLFDSKKTFQRPTKDGVSLKLEQARRLDSLLPLIVNELQSGNPQEVVPLPLGDEMYLSFQNWDGQFKTHVRKWTPLSNIDPNTDTPDKLQSTKNGITLTASQVCKLSEQLSKMFELLQPEFTQPYQPSMIRQQPSTSNYIAFEHTTPNYFGSTDNATSSYPQPSMIAESADSNLTHSLNFDSMLNGEAALDVADFWETLPPSQAFFQPPPAPKKQRQKAPRRRYTKRAKLFPAGEKLDQETHSGGSSGD